MKIALATMALIGVFLIHKIKKKIVPQIREKYSNAGDKRPFIVLAIDFAITWPEYSLGLCALYWIAGLEPPYLLLLCAVGTFLTAAYAGGFLMASSNYFFKADKIEKLVPSSESEVKALRKKGIICLLCYVLGMVVALIECKVLKGW